MTGPDLDAHRRFRDRRRQQRERNRPEQNNSYLGYSSRKNNLKPSLISRMRTKTHPQVPTRQPKEVEEIPTQHNLVASQTHPPT